MLSDYEYGGSANVGRKFLSFICVLLVLLLCACGTKQSGQTQIVVPPRSDQARSSTLSGRELEALNSAGQIDSEVPSSHMDDVAREYEYYLRKGRATIRASSKNAEKYLSYAKNVFRSQGMPDELAYLAIVESGYRPDAKSRVGAAGAWQFMPDTGTRFGLRQDWWTDERLDPYRSTEAAAAYLKKLYIDFGDWSTAIAAYNAGEGKINRAKAGTGGNNFFEVKALNHKLDDQAQLRDETKKYVPRFMAVSKIMRNLPQLGFDPIDPDGRSDVLRFTVRPGTDLVAFSNACSLSWQEFNSYNKHHKRVISCTDKPSFVYVPLKAKDVASNFIHSQKESPYAGWAPVRVLSSRETWDKISRRCSVPIARLKSANPEVGRLVAGQILLLPANIKMIPDAVIRGNTNSQKKLAVNSKTIGNDPPHSGGAKGSIGKKSGRIKYIVQEKDNLWRIARKHNVTVADLKKWNNVDEGALRPGTGLYVEMD